MTEIPEEAREAAQTAILAHMRVWYEGGSVTGKVICKACGYVDDQPYGWPKHQADVAVSAALPHLRVQETPPWEGITSREPEGEALAQMRKWYADNDLSGPPDATDPPHPRPVVDRVALIDALGKKRCVQREDGEDGSWDFPVYDEALQIAEVVLALLPTEEGEGS